MKKEERHDELGQCLRTKKTSPEQTTPRGSPRLAHATKMFVFNMKSKASLCNIERRSPIPIPCGVNLPFAGKVFVFAHGFCSMLICVYCVSLGFVAC